MFNDDEYYLDDEDLAADTQLSIVDEHKVKVLDSIISTSLKLKDAIKFNEHCDANALTEIIVGYVSNLVKLEALSQDDDLSEEEIQGLLLEIERSTTEITYSNIDKLVKDENIADEITEDTDEDDGSSLDF